MERTKLSSKGQLVLPSAVRTRHNWGSGTEFDVVDTPEGVLLKPVSPFPRTRLEDVAGSSSYRGPTISLEEMDAAVMREAKRHK